MYAGLQGSKFFPFCAKLTCESKQCGAEVNTKKGRSLGSFWWRCYGAELHMLNAKLWMALQSLKTTLNMIKTCQYSKKLKIDNLA